MTKEDLSVQASTAGSGDWRVPHQEGPVGRLRGVCPAQGSQVLAGVSSYQLFQTSVILHEQDTSIFLI